MHSALLVIETSGVSDPDKQVAWFEIEKTVASIEPKCAGLQKLSDNVFLIPLKNGLSAFGTLLHAAQEGFPCRVLFLDEEPAWISSETGLDLSLE